MLVERVHGQSVSSKTAKRRKEKSGGWGRGGGWGERRGKRANVNERTTNRHRLRWCAPCLRIVQFSAICWRTDLPKNSRSSSVAVSMAFIVFMVRCIYRIYRYRGMSPSVVQFLKWTFSSLQHSAAVYWGASNEAAKYTFQVWVSNAYTAVILDSPFERKSPASQLYLLGSFHFRVFLEMNCLLHFLNTIAFYFLPFHSLPRNMCCSELQQ